MPESGLKELVGSGWGVGAAVRAAVPMAALLIAAAVVANATTATRSKHLVHRNVVAEADLGGYHCSVIQSWYAAEG